jgi:hypothetical protein
MIEMIWFSRQIRAEATSWSPCQVIQIRIKSLSRSNRLGSRSIASLLSSAPGMSRYVESLNCWASFRPFIPCALILLRLLRWATTVVAELWPWPLTNAVDWPMMRIVWEAIIVWLPSWTNPSKLLTLFELLYTRFWNDLGFILYFLKRICGRVHTVPAFQWYVDNQQPEDVTIILKHVGLNDGYSEGLAFTLSGQSANLIVWFNRI